MKIRRLRHIGLAVMDLDQAVRLYREVFGLEAQRRRRSDSEGMEAVTLLVGDVEIELMQPTAPDSPIGRFIERRGEGIHHLAYEVDDLPSALKQVQAAGLEALDTEPREGLDGSKVAFIHPRSMNGVLTELVEEAR